MAVKGWWVHYGNYFPREVESTHATQEEAERERDRLNDVEGSSGMWECEEMP